MTAIVLPDIDRSTIEELKKRIPDLSEIELTLPTRKDVGRTAREVRRTADATIDRLLGRKPAPIWPWIAAGIGLVAVIGAVAAWFAWFRRPAAETRPEPWSATTGEPERATVISPTEPGLDVAPGRSAARAASRPAAARARAEVVGSAPYPLEEA